MKEYRVRYGDTLATLGKKFYGDWRFGMVIYQHNRHYIADPNIIYPGQMLALPWIDTENGTAFVG